MESPRQKKGALSVHYERKSQLCRIHKLISKTAGDTKEALFCTVDSLPLHLFCTFTFDNGSENTKHTSLKEAFDIENYFCDPYCSWQKGGVENCNKLIRQYFPKGTVFADVAEEEILFVENRLNNRPRKSLNFLSPNEAISHYLEGGATNT